MKWFGVGVNRLAKDWERVKSCPFVAKFSNESVSSHGIRAGDGSS